MDSGTETDAGERRLESMDTPLEPLMRYGLDPLYDRYPNNIILRNLPNILTIIRMICAPYVAYKIWDALAHYTDWRPVAISLLLLGVLFVTDGADGTIARRYDLESGLGRFLDPMADKEMVWLVLVALCIAAAEVAPWWLYHVRLVVLVMGLLEVVIYGVTIAELGVSVAVMVPTFILGLMSFKSHWRRLRAPRPS
jgi:phosphatidylglycerophosphate synthase